MQAAANQFPHGFSRTELSAVLSVVVLLGLLLQAQAALIRPVSVPGLPVVSGAGNSFTPSFSGDGRFVVFVSQANNLVTNDNLAPHLDVFIRDLRNHRTALVSVNSSGIGGGDGNSNFPTVSSNGQFVAFESVAANLAGTDTNGTTDVFLRDTLQGVTRLVSVSTDGIHSGNGPSSNPTITPDGRWLVFESAASDLVANDTNGVIDVFVRDLVSGVTVLASVGETNKSGSPSITPDGRFVAYVTVIPNSGPPPPALATISVRDVLSSASMNIGDQATNFFPTTLWPIRCVSPVISADGHFVAYVAIPREDSSAPASLMRYELQTATTLLVSSNTVAANPPEVSADGRFIAYENGTNVYLWDGQTGSSSLVSVGMDGISAGNRPSHIPVLSPDGSKVVFLSAATDLATNASNGLSQVFVRDLTSGTTRLVSANLADAASSVDIDVTLPAISADGRFVAFESAADDLVSGDFNFASDIFVRDLGANTTELVSAREQTLAPATGVSVSSVLANGVSADGRVIAFLGRDGNFTAGDTNRVPDAFVRDLAAGTNYLLRVPTIPLPLYFDTSPSPAVSTNGLYVAFVSPEQSARYVWRRDLQTGADTRASVSSAGGGLDGTAPAITGNGGLVAFQSSASASLFVANVSQGSGRTNVFLHDFQSGSNQLISASMVTNTSGNAD